MTLQTHLLAKAANQARGLAIDAVHACSSGHLGLPLGAAEIGAVLYGHALVHNPEQSTTTFIAAEVCAPARRPPAFPNDFRSTIPYLCATFEFSLAQRFPEIFPDPSRRFVTYYVTSSGLLDGVGDGRERKSPASLSCAKLGADS